MKSQAEHTLRLLLDDCVEEKEQVEAGLATLEKYLAKMKANQEKIDEMKKDGRKAGGGGTGGGNSSNSSSSSAEGELKAQIKKFEREIQTLLKAEAEREKEEARLRRKLEELQWEEDNAENSLKEDDGVEKRKDLLEARLQVIKALSAWPISSST